MDFYKDFPERSDAGTATTPDGGIVAGSDKLNDNDYAMIGANGTGSNSQGKGYKVKFSSIYNYIKSKLLGDSGMEATSERRGLFSAADYKLLYRNVAINKTAGIALWKFTLPSQVNTNEMHTLGIVVYDKGTSAEWAKTKLRVEISGGFYALKPAINVTYSRTFDNGYSLNSITFVRGGVDGSRPVLYVRFNQIPSDIQIYTSSDDFDITPTDTVITDGRIVDDVKFIDNGTKINAIDQQTLAASYIAERYSLDEEQALTRRMIANDPTVVEQFEAYSAYCEECKTKAKEELANQPQVLPANELNNQTN